MTDEAANSLLKTLEEPPQNNIMILKVSEPLALLPTILSRCQKVLFQPISIQAIRDWLVDKKEMKKEQALVLANISEGSLGKAIHLYESDYLEKRQDYLSKLFQLPGLSQEKALEMALEFTGKTKKRALRASETGDVTLFDLLGVWKTWYRDLLLMKVKCPADLLINIDFFHELKISPKGIKIDDLINSFMIVDQAQRELQRSRNLDLMMENTLLALKNLNPGFS
jgi:DNA polymerase-3 subunit delta'